MSDNQENNNNENNNNQNNNNQKSNVAGIVTVLVVLFVIIAIFIFLFAKLINFVESIIFSDDFKDMANNAVQQIEQKTYDSQLESLTEELVGVLEDEDTYVQYDIYNGAITIDIFRQDLTVPEEELDATRFGIEFQIHYLMKL